MERGARASQDLEGARGGKARDTKLTKLQSAEVVAMSPRRCSRCHSLGHTVAECTNEARPRECIDCGGNMERPRGSRCYRCEARAYRGLRGQPTHKRCSICGGYGHNARGCEWRTREAIVQAIAKGRMRIEEAQRLFARLDELDEGRAAA